MSKTETQHCRAALHEHYGLDEIVSEDFEDGRFYGSVRAKNPFSATKP
jgi:hypothetical protein